MYIGETIEDFGSLVGPEETERMWCCFRSHSGHYWTVAHVLHDSDAELFCVAGEPIAACAEYDAKRLVNAHNEAIYGALG